jgi:hypothetical protein
MSRDEGTDRPSLTPDILVEDLVAAYPGLIGPLLRRGVICMVCGEPYWGTLAELAGRKGITDTEALIADLEEELAGGDDGT